MEYPFLGKNDNSVVEPMPKDDEICTSCEAQGSEYKYWSERDARLSGERPSGILCESCAVNEFGEERVKSLKDNSEYL